ncbi:NAC domain-containing protein [Asimina triloba]
MLVVGPLGSYRRICSVQRMDLLKSPLIGAYSKHRFFEGEHVSQTKYEVSNLDGGTNFQDEVAKERFKLDAAVQSRVFRSMSNACNAYPFRRRAQCIIRPPYKSLLKIPASTVLSTQPFQNLFLFPSYFEEERRMKLDLPAGFRFLPTDIELLGYYLRNKMLCHNLPTAGFIHDCYIYDFNPDQLAGMYGVGDNGEMYFFTKRERKTSHATRPDRTAGDGYWKSNRTHVVVDDGGMIWGYKMNLKFHKGTSPKGIATDWLMDEYRIEKTDQPQNPTQSNMMSGYVLCRIHRHKSQGQSRKRSFESIEMPTDERNLEGMMPPYACSGLSNELIAPTTAPTQATGSFIGMPMIPSYPLQPLTSARENLAT